MSLPNAIEKHDSGAMSFTGPDGVGVFRATVIANGLRLYAKTGMRPNRNYTPKAMMAAAAQITGQKFKARDYLGAAESLTAWAHSKASTVHAETAVREGSEP